MTIHRAAAYLIRFDEAPAAPIVAAGENDDASVMEPLTPPQPEPPAPVAIEPLPPQRTEEEILAEAEAGFAERLAMERESFDQRLRDERARWVHEQGERLGRALLRSQEEAMRALRDELTRILSPFVSREIVERVADDVIAAMRLALANEDAPALSVSAPKDLLERIETTLKSENVSIKAQESEQVDAHVAFAATIVESRLQDWISQLSKERDASR